MGSITAEAQIGETVARLEIRLATNAEKGWKLLKSGSVAARLLANECQSGKAKS